MKIPAIYMAAGQSSRMGTAKQSLTLFPGITLGSMALRVLLSSGITDIYIVVRPEDPLDWISGDLVDNPALHIVRCFHAPLGMSFSLRCGLDAAIDELTHAVLIVLADQPFINETIITDLLSTFNTYPDLDYVASTTSEGVLTPPVVLARSMFVAVRQLEGDVGARKLLGMPQYQGDFVHCDDPLLLYDVDNQEDWLNAVAYYSNITTMS